MKKLFITIIAILLPMLAMGQTLLYGQDFTGITEFDGWVQFDDSQTDGKVEITSEGLAITVGIQTGQLWQPQIMVITDGSLDLEVGSKYTVVVTAKFPSDGTLQISMGTWGADYQAQFPVTATGGFQTVECESSIWSFDSKGAHLLFQCGDFKGTTILKKIEVWKGDAIPSNKWTVAGDEILLGANWDVTQNTNIMKTFDHENFTLKKTDVMLPKGTYEFKVINNTATDESYPSSNASLEIEEDAVYALLFTFNSNTKEVTATARKTDGIFYKYITKGKIAEVIQNPNKYKGNIIIPEKVTHKGVDYTITKIAENAFYQCNALTSVEISNSVTSIGYCAFAQCNGLTSIEIPNNVTSIGDYAFSGCSGLTSIVIPNSVTSIGGGAFSNCNGLTSIVTSNSVTSIGGGAFSGCSGLTSIVIPNSVTSIGGGAFSGCSGLTSIEIPNNVTYIGEGAFQSCSGITSVFIKCNLNNIGEYIFKGCSNIKEVTFDCETIYSLFNNKSSIEKVTMTDKVTYIDYSAFSGCSGLTSIEIPNNVTSIGDYAFSGCSGLTSIKIPNSVTSIGESVFRDCSSLTSIEIPNSVTSIGYRTFYNCSCLTSIKIPNSVTSIGNGAFQGCSGITSVTIPNSVTSIGSYAFEKCSGLIKVIIGENIKNLYTHTFAYCDKMQDFYCYAYHYPTAESNVFEKSYIDYVTLHVPQDAIKQYADASPWKNFKKIVAITDEDTDDREIVGQEFTVDGIYYIIGENNTVSVISKTEKYSGDVVIPSQVEYHGVAYSVTSISNSAFDGCSELTSVSLPSSLKIIESGAFYKCSGLTSVIIPEGVTEIGLGAFSGCRSMITLDIPSTVTAIDKYAFDKCTSLSRIVSEIQQPFAIDNSVFATYDDPYNVYSMATLVVPDGSKSVYQTTAGWSNFKSIVQHHEDYKLTYYVDGEEYKSVTYNYGAEITPESAPTKEGYTFSGWSYIPRTMPAEEVNVFGFFTINQYTITYMIDGEKYATEMVDFNSKITPPTPPSKDGFDFAWDEYPDIMPAHDITINGAYTTTGILSIAIESGKAKIFTLDGRQLDTLQKGINIIMLNDGTIKKMVIK